MPACIPVLLSCQKDTDRKDRPMTNITPLSFIDLRAMLHNLPDGAIVESRKYKIFGEWGEWKAITPERALHRLNVHTHEGYCPYDVRVMSV